MGCIRSKSQLLKEDKLHWTNDSTVLLVIMRSLAKKEKYIFALPIFSENIKRLLTEG